MVLSVPQQAVVSVVLVLCLLVVMPRMFGGGGGGGRAGRAPRGGRAGPGHFEPRQQQQHRGSPQTVHQGRPNPGNPEGSVYQSIQQMRNAMAKEIKSERTRGNGRDLAFTLMPLYALGVGVFAAYKFLKMKAHEENLSEKEKSTEEKAKETEHQLLELEQHLAQTEKMLNSLLTQLDPLSNWLGAVTTALGSLFQLPPGKDPFPDADPDAALCCSLGPLFVELCSSLSSPVCTYPGLPRPRYRIWHLLFFNFIQLAIVQLSNLLRSLYGRRSQRKT
ncbi:coiled-coil domain-containing protein 107 isoform X2 [Lagopus leucura]|uniref:coiled-coil domain-containing protein 107 isoform X2 n=1 Tax=Lagopus leucura TaxID=30410 RepID=UPI001C683CEE|nr:coiled-coil domain-containing protein 107 isoform X2 [Lagopus leucura]